MIKQRWNISNDEKFRILKLHEDATKNYYLIIEQTEENSPIEPIKFKLPNNPFKGGKYLNFDKPAVDEIIIQVKEYLKKYPLNQKVELEIESSESKVTNYDRERFPTTGKPSVDYTKEKKLKQGELSKLRAQTIQNYLKTNLPENISISIKNLGAQGPNWEIPEGATTEEIIKLANDPKYTQWQYVSFNLIVSGESQEEICDLGFYVIVDYQKEWCKPEDTSRCHKCNDAIFLMWANGIPLTNEKGYPQIDLNNGYGSGPSGPSREVRLYVSKEQKKQILEQNPEEILITWGCDLYYCHSDPAHVTIIDTNGSVLLPPTFITSGGKRMKKTDPPVNLLKLDKCGKKIAVAGEEGMGQTVTTPKPKIKAFELKYDKGRPTVESLYEIYKFVDNGILKIPQDKIEYFRTYKGLNGKPWSNIRELYSVNNNLMKKLIEFAETKNNQ